ncbi:MAG: chromosome segregation protein SMC [Oscillospiraceae bacterium]|nr:chromosome segregation protein SMC [Oscillospiraceae bacterium]
MLLKYLDIQGFKSFPDKTRVTFGRGLTGVVGPNGSGKSNISDAVRWVLGEQSTKTLRGERMEDVIFSGTQSRRSQGFAEVSLTVDNSDRALEVDSDEVTLTRRYDRSGESEYMINRAPVRLRDVHELLMDTGLGKDGYSLIGQGKIAEIIQSKSSERREIFEEAAGISKYRYRKNESERSLARAEENLVRLRDILAELEGRVEPLREQAEKAKQFLELSQQKKSLEVSLWIDTIEKSNQSLKDQSDRLLVCQQKHDSVGEDIREIENRIQAAFEAMQKCLVDIESMRREKARLEGEAAEAASRIAVCENDILHNEQNRERIAGELADYARSADSAADEIQAREAQIRSLQEALSARREEADAKQAEILSHQGETEQLTQQERELTDRVNGLLLEQSQIKMSIASARLNLSELAESLRDGRGELETRTAEAERYARELSEAERFTGVLEERIEGLRNAWQGHKLKLENRNQQISSQKQELDRMSLRMKELQQKASLLEGMEQSLEGYAYSVKEVLKRSKSGVLTGILGTVSQLIQVEEEYAAAIETALGGAMQNLVTEDESAAKSAIRLLKQDNLGRATFLPLTSVQGGLLQVQGLEQYGGYVDLACNLIAYDPRYRQVMESLLGRIAIVDDLDTATIIARKYGYKFRIVTLDGQVVNAGGSMTGGSRNKSQNFLSRKNEIHALHGEIQSLREKSAGLTAQLRELQESAARMEAEVTAAAAEITTANEDRIRAEGEQKRLRQLAEQGGVLLARLKEELSLRQEKEAGQREALVQGESRLTVLEEELRQGSEALSQLQSSSRGAAARRALLSEELSSLRIGQLGLEKDMEAVRQSIRDLEARRNSTDQQAARLEEQRRELAQANEGIRRDIQTLQAQAEACRGQIAGLDQSVAETMSRRQELEGETTSLRRQERELQEDKARLASELVRLDERRIQIQREYDGLISKLWEEYELTRSEAQKLAQRLEDPNAANRELLSLRSRIRALGSVNVDAIEEYREVRERYDFLKGQISDAERSRNELLRLIQTLTEQMCQIFADNFKKISHQFQSIFTQLFGGGQGELRLVEPDNLLESGIEILVAPPGKIINNLAALSGGEQAFVAIAIYFAILKVHPAPFCILDEIEAALDDVNVDKYAAYLRTLLDQTQFIAITHRRGTMEAADILYGVTMQEEGVSKLLQLKVAEIESKLGMGSV